MRGRLWLTGMLLLAPTTAFAQSQAPLTADQVPTNVSVSERGRPDYDPIGGRVGSFFLYPRLDANLQYTSNLRAAEDNTISDVFFDIRPSARLASLWSRHQLEASVFYQRSIHARYSREDVSAYGGSASGRYDIGRGGIGVNVSAAKVAEPRSDINSNLASREPITFTSLSAAATISQDFNRLGVLASGGVSRQKFDDAIAFDGTPLPQDFRDNTNYNASLEGSLLLGAGTRVIARAQTGSIRYDTNPIFGFDRNSSSYRIEGGVRLNLTDLISGSATVGYFRQNNNDRRLLDSSGLSFSANLLYTPSALTSVRLVADRSVEPGGSTVTAGNVRSTAIVTVEHELRPNLVVIGDGRYSNFDPQGEIDNATEYGASVGAQYYFSRRYRFNARVGYSARNSNFFPEYKAVNGTLGISVTL